MWVGSGGHHSTTGNRVDDAVTGVLRQVATGRPTRWELGDGGTKVEEEGGRGAGRKVECRGGGARRLRGRAGCGVASVTTARCLRSFLSVCGRSDTVR